MTEAVDATEEVGRSFKRVHAAARRLRGRETNRHGEVSYAQYSLLFGLHAEGGQSAAELARAADLSAPTVAQMLESMEAHGLVTRERSQTDKRVLVVSLTPRGEQVIAARRAAIEPRWRAVLAEFSEHELLAASAVMDRLADFFDTMLDEGL